MTCCSLQLKAKCIMFKQFHIEAIKLNVHGSGWCQSDQKSNALLTGQSSGADGCMPTAVSQSSAVGTGVGSGFQQDWKPSCIGVGRQERGSVQLLMTAQRVCSLVNHHFVFGSQQTLASGRRHEATNTVEMIIFQDCAELILVNGSQIVHIFEKIATVINDVIPIRHHAPHMRTCYKYIQRTPCICMRTAPRGRLCDVSH